MGKWDNLSWLNATAQAELVRRKEVQAAELVEAAIERIERLNPALNAVVTPMYEEALAMARRPLPKSPLAGVPFLLKDLLALYRGVRMTAGSRFLRDFVPDHHSELVARFQRAGLLIVGKTNTPELGILPTTEPELFGPCRNPWDRSLTPGGSSGGAAAAVAAGLVPMAHGNDGGGSLRIPASCCGVFGLKPTRARNPLGPDVGDLMSGLVVEHVLTRSVRDSAAALDATAGPDVGDPYWAPPPVRAFLEETRAEPGRLRIALIPTPFTGGPVHKDCLRAAQEAAALCRELGHEVEEARFPADGEPILQAFLTIWAAGCAAAVERSAFVVGRRPTSDQFEPLTWALAEKGWRYSSAEYLLAVQTLQWATRDLARRLAPYDVWLTPTLAEPPVPLGTFEAPPEDPLQAIHRAVQFTPFTGVANFTGLPAMSVPLGQAPNGLPIGVQFIGRFGDEATLLRLAAQLEQARPWADRHPPV
ncbi:MAG: amidase [Acidobacteria bacterium]|nr:amidase [Acidobacteriota bacterium]